MSRCDAFGIARIGTGKTGAFVLPISHNPTTNAGLADSATDIDHEAQYVCRLRETATPHQGKIMQIFVFKSEARSHLRAFAGDSAGDRLPKQFGPWSATGAIAPDGNPPHNLSREVIEAAIKERGFQLWRRSKRDRSNPTE
jgi:hypothetical protein